MLFSLWLFATLEGENSARRIADLTTRDLAYLWICGGVSVNYHTLSDFRTKHRELLEKVLTDSIAVLHYHDLIKLETIAQDGMRVRIRRVRVRFEPINPWKRPTKPPSDDKFHGSKKKDQPKRQT